MTDVSRAAGTATEADTGTGAEPPRGRWLGRFRTGVWRQPDFLKMWIGQTTSQFGSQITMVASPLVAVVVLHVTAGQMGLLNALARVPFVLYPLAGVWVDRMRRRPLVIGSDLARGLMLLVIPIAAVTGVLSFWLLVGLTVCVMFLTVWFDIAYMSYVPRLVDRDHLMQANTVLESSRSTAQIAGPGIGGVLVQAFTAPMAIIADAVSYFVSAFAVWRIRRPEPRPAPADGAGARGVLDAVVAGVRYVARHRLLGPLALAIGVSNMMWAAELALYMLFVADGLGLRASLIGLTLAAGGPGALLGSMLAGRAQRVIGLSGAIIGGLGLFAVSGVLIPFAPHNAVIAVPMLILAEFGMSVGGQVCAVNVLTTRQQITPDELLGRVNASFRFMGLGISPLGSLLGGLLGSVLGLRTGMALTVAGLFIAPLIVLVSPVRGVRSVSEGDVPESAGAPENEQGPQSAGSPNSEGETS